MATIKEMQEKLEITQKLLEAEGKLTKLTEIQREAIQSTAGLLKQNREQTQLAVDDAQRRLDIVQKQFDKNQLTAEQAVNRQAAIKKELEGHKQVLEFLNLQVLKNELNADQRQRVLDINRQITAEKAKQLVTSSSSGSSSSDEGSQTDSSSDSNAQLDESDALWGTADAIPWKLAKGRLGRIHIVGLDDVESDVVVCGRRPANPERGVGLPDAVASGTPHEPCVAL